MHYQNIKSVKSLVDMKQLEESFKPKSTITKSIVSYGCMILLASTVLNSCSPYRINRLKNKSYKEWKTFQWTEIKSSSDQDVTDWTIYSRKFKGTNLTEFKIEGEIGASPENCIVAFRQEINQQAAKIDNKKYPAYQIISESADSLLTYVIHNEPFPFKDTEMLVQYVFSTSKDGSKEVKLKESRDEYSIEESKKTETCGNLSRVLALHRGWRESAECEKHSSIRSKGHAKSTISTYGN